MIIARFLALQTNVAGLYPELKLYPFSELRTGENSRSHTPYTRFVQHGQKHVHADSVSRSLLENGRQLEKARVEIRLMPEAQRAHEAHLRLGAQSPNKLQFAFEEGGSATGSNAGQPRCTLRGVVSVGANFARQDLSQHPHSTRGACNRARGAYVRLRCKSRRLYADCLCLKLYFKGANHV